MDVAEYVGTDSDLIRQLSSRSLVQVRTIQGFIRNRKKPLRYLTALRLVRASDGAITLKSLEERGPLKGREAYDGPLGNAISDIASEGDTVSTRLAKVGLRDNHLVEILLRGAMPRKETRSRLIEAFGEGISEDLFRRHAEWRRQRQAGAQA